MSLDRTGPFDRDLAETPCNITQLVPAVRPIHCIRTVKLKKKGLNIEF